MMEQVKLIDKDICHTIGYIAKYTLKNIDSYNT